MNDDRCQLDATPDALRSAFEAIAPNAAQEAKWREAMRERQTTQAVSRERVPWIWVGASAAAAVLAIASTLIVPLSSQDVIAGAEQPWQVIRMNVESTLRAPVEEIMRFAPGGEKPDASMAMNDAPSMSMDMTAPNPGLMPHVPMVRLDWLTEPFDTGWSMVKPLFGAAEVRRDDVGTRQVAQLNRISVRSK